jgi:multisubunit Na+/H+ antiporter MnhG subunit
MDIAYTVKYIFEDRKWIQKLLPLFGLGIISLIPIFGLLAVVIALGFMAQLARNVRDGLPRPLPEWKDLTQKFQIGGDVILAMLAYNLPTILVSLCSMWLITGIGGGFLGPAVSFFALCCTLPIFLLYTTFSWSLLATGFTEYLQTGQAASFYRFSHLWDVMQAHSAIVTSWALYAFFVNLLIMLLIIIPVLGWALIMFFAFPVHGHLLGQFAHKMGVTTQIKARDVR